MSSDGLADARLREPAGPATSQAGGSGRGEPAASGPAPAGSAAGRAAGRWAAAGLISALAIMVAAGWLHRSWMPPHLVMPALGPPFQLASHVSPRLVVVLLWLSGLLAVGGVAAGLSAVRRGQPVPMRAILSAAAIAIALLAVVPPVGSTDVLDYAIYGHIAALGRSPYVITPAQYGQLLHLRSGVPADWQNEPSYYGPLATAEQFLAARLAGASLAVTAFWLKLVTALAFAGVALLADRVLRSDPAARLRAHLLWTANPLLIWSVIAAGHVDMLAAAAGLAGLLISDRWVAAAPLVRAAAAGLAIGAAVAIKADYALFGLALAVALRWKPAQLLAAAGAAMLILVPSYLAVGTAAVRALAGRVSQGVGYGFYPFFFHPLGIRLSDAVPVAAVLTVAVGWLALNRLPAGWQGDRAVRAGLAVSLAWLLLWPHEFAWYGVMMMCVLIFYPASRLDWLALAWLGAMTIADLPGVGIDSHIPIGRALAYIERQNTGHLAPVVMLIALAALIALCVSGRWHGRARAAPAG